MQNRSTCGFVGAASRRQGIITPKPPLARLHVCMAHAPVPAHRALRTLNHTKPQHVRFCWGRCAASGCNIPSGMFHKNIHTVIFDGRPERTICDAVLQCDPGTLRFPAQPLPCTGENRGRRANLPCEKYRTLCRAAAARRSGMAAAVRRGRKAQDKIRPYRRAEGRASAEHRQPGAQCGGTGISGLRRVRLDSQRTAPRIHLGRFPF